MSYQIDLGRVDVVVLMPPEPDQADHADQAADHADQKEEAL